MIKILIVEDQAILRETMEYSINGQSDMEVVGATGNAENSLELCRTLQPDLVLMDVVTKDDSNGIAFSAIIRKEFPNIKIVIMTGFPEITFISEAKKADAHSFIYKDIGKEQLFSVIHNTIAGYSVYPSPSDYPRLAVQLTETEIAVLRLVCRGKTREESAKEMGLSEATLGRHITSILDKSGFDNIAQFAIYAVGQGLILPGKND